MNSLGLAFTDDNVAAVMVREGKVTAIALQSHSVDSRSGRSWPAKAIFHCLKQEKIDDLSRIPFLGVATDQVNSLSELWRPQGEGGRGWLDVVRELPGQIIDEVQFRFWLRRCVEVMSGDARPETFLYETDDIWPLAMSLRSPHPKVAVLRVGRDELEESSGLWLRQGDDLNLVWSAEHPQGWGVLVRNLSEFCGFSGISGRWQFLKLAQYGEPRFVDLIRDELMEFSGEDGLWRSNWDYLNPEVDHEGQTKALSALFDEPARMSHEPITSREIDLAHSLQCVVKEFATMIAQTLREHQVQHVMIHSFEPLGQWLHESFKREPFIHGVDNVHDPIKAPELALASALMALKNGGAQVDLSQFRGEANPVLVEFGPEVRRHENDLQL